ncbi:MAG: rhodanese-like domain-containing protein [bacterium]|nr:rhodanese-like domain-containing protein [bacterium]
MSLINYFKPVKNITVAEAREMMEGKDPSEYCLLDVRRLSEHREKHVPGSVLIPVAELPDRLNELDPEKLTIVYCAIGGRSRAGASILGEAGFREVYNMKGGIKAWNGPTGEGLPEGE